MQRFQLGVARFPMDDVLDRGLGDAGQRGKPVDRYAALVYQIFEPFSDYIGIRHMPYYPLF